MLPSFCSSWKHVFKLDPERPITDEALEVICHSGTDAILLGGSSGLTYDNTVDLLSRVRRYEVPCALELSDPSCGVPGFDGYFIPMVLNTKHGEWITGHHAAALRDYGHLLPWDQVIGEAYLVLHENSTVAKVTGANTRLNPNEVMAYSLIADRLWNAPVLYMEYSGVYGDMLLVQRVKDSLKQAQLFYGGGIDSAQRAAEAAKAAHTVVVGNVIYDNLDAALATVSAVKPSIKEQDHVF